MRKLRVLHFVVGRMTPGELFRSSKRGVEGPRPKLVGEAGGTYAFARTEASMRSGVRRIGVVLVIFAVPAWPAPRPPAARAVDRPGRPSS